MIGVGVIVTDRAGRVLLGHRTKPTEPATWCLPGGAVEAGETFETAAARELAEETGIVVDAAGLDVRGVVLDDDDGAPRVSAAVHVREPGAWTARVTEPHVFSTWDWFPLPDGLPAPLFPATAHVLRLVYATAPAPGLTAAYPATANARP